MNPIDFPSRGRAVGALLNAALVAGAMLPAQEGPAPKSGAAAEAVRTLAGLLEERYVDAKLGARCGAEVKQALADGALPLDRPDALVVDLQRRLRAITSDLHLSVTWTEPGPSGEDSNEPEPPEDGDDWSTGGRVSNHGFKKVERLVGNVGLLELTSFWQPENGGQTAIAAMRFLQDVDAIIIDLRDNSGGSSEMVKLMASWLLPPRTPLAGIHWRPKPEPDQAWSEAWIDAPRLTDIPAFVLTNSATFSAAEALAYDLQVVDRARVVGGKTRGGAHPGGSFELGHGYSAWIPTGRAVHPETGGNWEGVGIEPDVPVDSTVALQRAHGLALRAIRERAAAPGWRHQLQWQIEWLDAQAAPAPVAPELASELCGSYGIERVFVQGDQLWCQREEAAPWRVFGDGKGTFHVSGRWDYRFRFERDDGGVITALRGSYASGREFVRPRRGQ